MWIYNQKTGSLTDAAGVIIGLGYSGYGDGKNNPARQDTAKIGPIPTGYYAIGSPFTHPHSGPITMRLEPNPLNQMYGRSGFMIHGDNQEHNASEGCIIMTRAVRLLLAESPDRCLKVI